MSTHLQNYMGEDVVPVIGDMIQTPVDYARKCLVMNKHNHVTTTYYLLARRKFRAEEDNAAELDAAFQKVLVGLPVPSGVVGPSSNMAHWAMPMSARGPAPESQTGAPPRVPMTARDYAGGAAPGQQQWQATNFPDFRSVAPARRQSGGVPSRGSGAREAAHQGYGTPRQTAPHNKALYNLVGGVGAPAHHHATPGSARRQPGGQLPAQSVPTPSGAVSTTTPVYGGASRPVSSHLAHRGPILTPRNPADSTFHPQRPTSQGGAYAVTK